MNYKIEQFNKYSDLRGDLIVFLKKSELPKGKQSFGQIYFVTFNKKGVVRGNHYHKKWSEWFGIVEGKVKVILEDVITKKRKTFIFDSKKDQYVRLNTCPNIAHSFKSLSDFAALLNYADSKWSNKDTFNYILM